MTKIVEVKPGEGGEDAEAFADDLAVAIQRWATSKQLSITTLSNRTFEVGGRKECL